MSKGLLALEDLLSVLPSGADYDTVLAAIMASEGGRWFLDEYANRNRHADTNLVVGALARVEAAIRGEAVPQPAVPTQAEPAVSSAASEPPVPPELASSQMTPASSTAAPVLCRDLIEIGAAIDRIEALVKSEMPASDGYGAIERIRDIAFALRAREFESALCDALEYSARSVSEILEFSDSTAQRGRTASELLNELAGRIKDMIELTIAAQKAKPPAILDVSAPAIETGAAGATDVAAVSMIGEGARTVAASDTAVVDAAPETVECSVAAAPVTTDLVTPDLGAPDAPPSAGVQEAPVVTVISNGTEPEVPVRTADIDHSATAEDVEGLAAHRDADPEARSEDGRAIEDERAEAPRAVAPEPESAIDIDEDPGDLFEPMPISGALYSLPVQTTVIMVTPIAPIQSAPRLALNRPTIVPNNYPVGARAAADQEAPATAAATATETGVRQANEPPAAAPAEAADDVSARPLADTLPHANGGAAPIAPEISQQEPSDPLAPIRALREEELIALFS
jgi:hypothetical protein